MASKVTAKCRHCQKDLPVEHKGPCPYCGKVGKSIIATITEYISVTTSFNAQKVHRYTQKHPRFIALSIALTITSLIAGYLLGGLVGLLIGIIVAILNLWLTPHAINTVVEITSLGNKGMGTKEVKVENTTQQKRFLNKDIYLKLEGIEKKIDSSSRTQRFGILYALGVAFIILGLSYWPGLLELIEIDTGRFYLINPIVLIMLGSITLIGAYIVSRRSRK